MANSRPSGYLLVVTPHAERSLAALPEKVASAIVEFLVGDLNANPKRVGKLLLRELDGHYRARRASYRVIYSIDEKDRLIRVVRIDHRSGAYRTR